MLSWRKSFAGHWRPYLQDDGGFYGRERGVRSLDGRMKISRVHISQLFLLVV
jgi:hypothetical protein